MRYIHSIQFLLLLSFVYYIYTCAPTQANNPIVCPCDTSEVALLFNVGGTPGGTDSIQPVGTPTTGANGCATGYTVTCEGTNVIMEFQDALGGSMNVNSVELTCTDGNWIFNSPTIGDILVVSVQCYQ